MNADSSSVKEIALAILERSWALRASVPRAAAGGAVMGVDADMRSRLTLARWRCCGRYAGVDEGDHAQDELDAESARGRRGLKNSARIDRAIRIQWGRAPRGGVARFDWANFHRLGRCATGQAKCGHRGPRSAVYRVWLPESHDFTTRAALPLPAALDGPCPRLTSYGRRFRNWVCA